MSRVSCWQSGIEKRMWPRVIIVGYGTPVNFSEVKRQSCVRGFSVGQSLKPNGLELA